MRKWGYVNGWQAGFETASENFERILAICREEILNLKEDRNNQAQRADAACDLLLQHLGARAISRIGVTDENDRASSAQQFSAQLATDPTEDLPIGTPGSRYKTRDEALAEMQELGIMAEPEE